MIRFKVPGNPTGERLAPIWVDVEDLSTIERFGFTKADFD